MDSVNSSDGSHCIDIFRRPDGSFGFEEYRRDVEDGRGWFAVGGYAERRFDSADDARDAAKGLVVWFQGT